MMRGHDVFEALSGAVMLGEATPAEVAAFDAHAIACATCRTDADSGVRAIASMARARAEETWRPSVTGLVLERIARTRVRGARRTIGAFGWAIALSLVANVAFASGATNWLAPNFHASGEGSSTVATSTIGFDRAPARASAVTKAAISTPVSVLAARPHHKHRVHRALENRLERTPPTRSSSEAGVVAAGIEPVAAAPPDVLAGLDIEGASGQGDRLAGRRVAAAPQSCDGERETTRASGRDFEPDPSDDGCPAATSPVPSALPAAK